MTDQDRDHLPPYPEKDRRSFGYKVARTTLDAAVSAMPGAGYALGKVVEAVVAAPLQKRRDEWFASLGAAVIELQNRSPTIDAVTLAVNEDFVTAVFEATQCAMKTKSEEKLDALRNAVLNVASGLTLSGQASSAT